MLASAEVSDGWRPSCDAEAAPERLRSRPAVLHGLNCSIDRRDTEPVVELAAVFYGEALGVTAHRDGEAVKKPTWPKSIGQVGRQ